MHRWMETAATAGIVFGQLLFAGLALYAALSLLWPKRSVRWKRLAFVQWRRESVPPRLLKWLHLSPEHRSNRERALLLAGCGVTADPAWYMLARRLALCMLVLLAIVLAWLLDWRLAELRTQLLVGLPLSGAAALLLDRTWLNAFRRVRALQMTREIYAVSNQLLYLSDSSLNIHAKLMRCMVFTKAMRPDMERLLAEWYHDPGAALRHFKLRIGTDDGMSFVETIDALRLHEHEHFYELLRVRIADYKEKLELAREGRKESASYVLFILAGIPILYTFQVFIYPWVMEGQRLFASLG